MDSFVNRFPLFWRFLLLCALATGPFLQGLEATMPGCTLTCPPGITQGTDPGQCGAIVTYAPTASGSCGIVTCNPPSGAFFPVGPTPVSCTTTAAPSCGFNVLIVDNQAPTVTCPADMTLDTDP